MKDFKSIFGLNYVQLLFLHIQVVNVFTFTLNICIIVVCLTISRSYLHIRVNIEYLWSIYIRLSVIFDQQQS